VGADAGTQTFAANQRCACDIALNTESGLTRLAVVANRSVSDRGLRRDLAIIDLPRLGHGRRACVLGGWPTTTAFSPAASKAHEVRQSEQNQIPESTTTARNILAAETVSYTNPLRC
jgi:hypothetical protein